MISSRKAYKALIDELYEKKVKACPRCHGINPDCDCMKFFDRMCEIANAHIPYKFRYATTDQFVVEDDARSKAKVEKYVKYVDKMHDSGIGFWAHGRPGSGKTLLICAALISAIDKKLSTYYLDVSDFYRLQEIRFIQEQQIQYKKKTRLIHSVDVLAIDGMGLGVQGSKQASKTALADLIRDRTNSKLTTIVGSYGEDNDEAWKALSLVTKDMPALVRRSCPINIPLSGHDFVEEEAKKKQNFFDSLP